MFKAIAAEFHADLPSVVVASYADAGRAAVRRAGVRDDGRHVRPPPGADDQRRALFGDRAGLGLRAHLAVLLMLRALFGFAMGGVWGVGASLALELIPPKARGIDLGPAAGGLCRRLSDRLGGLLLPVRPHRLARHVHGGRGPGPAGRLHPVLRARVAGLRSRARGRAEAAARSSCSCSAWPRWPSRSARRSLGPMLKIPTLTWIYVDRRAAGARGLVVLPQALADGALRRRADDRLQLLQPRHPGPLPDLPAEGTRVRHRRDRAADHHRQRRRDRRRAPVRRAGRSGSAAGAASSSRPCSRCWSIPLWAFSPTLRSCSASARS